MREGSFVPHPIFLCHMRLLDAHGTKHVSFLSLSPHMRHGDTEKKQWCQLQHLSQMARAQRSRNVGPLNCKPTTGRKVYLMRQIVGRIFVNSSKQILTTTRIRGRRAARLKTLAKREEDTGRVSTCSTARELWSQRWECNASIYRRWVITANRARVDDGTAPAREKQNKVACRLRWRTRDGGVFLLPSLLMCTKYRIHTLVTLSCLWRLLFIWKMRV